MRRLLPRQRQRRGVQSLLFRQEGEEVIPSERPRAGRRLKSVHSSARTEFLDSAMRDQGRSVMRSRGIAQKLCLEVSGAMPLTEWENRRLLAYQGRQDRFWFFWPRELAAPRPTKEGGLKLPKALAKRLSLITRALRTLFALVPQMEFGHKRTNRRADTDL
jgi:hypothetical protein